MIPWPVGRDPHAAIAAMLGMPKLDRRQLLLAEQRRNVRQRQILQIGHVLHRHAGELSGRVRKGKGVWPNQCAGRGGICTNCQGGKKSTWGPERIRTTDYSVIV